MVKRALRELSLTLALPSINFLDKGLLDKGVRIYNLMITIMVKITSLQCYFC
ncbi:hypothetical protein FHS10_000935 [Mucilaginibacter dorajii]|nr:hypothetical protein [Mucilaginibacter dorajii]